MPCLLFGGRKKCCCWDRWFQEGLRRIDTSGWTEVGLRLAEMGMGAEGGNGQREQ